MSKRYYAKGKLLLTSEYVVLHGAKALALPLKLGQALSCVKKNEAGVLAWRAIYAGETWFETRIKLDDLSIIKSTSEEKARRLVMLLEACIALNPEFTEELNTRDITTVLEFDPRWGFGSSSTLISLLAQWAAIDPMQLYRKVSNGSGYDLACATAASSIIYQLTDDKPGITPVDFKPAFADKLWLVYRGEKQDTEESVSTFLEKKRVSDDDLAFFSGLTEDLMQAQTIDAFGSLLLSHEKRIAALLSKPRIGADFADFDGYVKSLGAWGGDFALFACERDKAYVREYLGSKQIDTYFSYQELVIA